MGLETPNSVLSRAIPKKNFSTRGWGGKMSTAPTCSELHILTLCNDIFRQVSDAFVRTHVRYACVGCL
jgi:hypothetical protein